MPSPNTSERVSPAGAAPLRAVRPLWKGLLRLVYPPACLGCGQSMPEAARPLCAACLAAMERADAADVEARLARLPSAQDVFDGAFALWIFSKGGALQQAHHALKYGNRPRTGVELGRFVGQAVRTQMPDVDIEAVVPVPLHRARLYERGYNQSSMLAQGAAAALERPVLDHVLRRPRPTHTQTHLSRIVRWQNVEGAFAVPDASLVRGRRLLLVDDVLTTGATAVAAAHALKEAGARTVALATLALASL